MPDYPYRCPVCRERFTITRSMTDDDEVGHCGVAAERIYEMPRIGAGALEVKGRSARLDAAAERRFDADRDAYKRLRKDGLQPRSINGSAVLETQAQTQFEVDYGQLFPSKTQQAKVREGIERTHDLGLAGE